MDLAGQSLDSGLGILAGKDGGGDGILVNIHPHPDGIGVILCHGWAPFGLCALVYQGLTHGIPNRPDVPFCLAREPAGAWREGPGRSDGLTDQIEVGVVLRTNPLR